MNLPAPLPPLRSLRLQPGRHGGRDVERAPGHAVADVLDLKHMGGRLYAATGVHFIFNPATGGFQGTRKINRTIELAQDGQSYETVARVTTFDLGQRRRDVQRESIGRADAARADSRSTVETEAARTKGLRGLSDLSSSPREEARRDPGGRLRGLELATRLSESLAEDVRVTLIDQNDSFSFGFSKLDVLLGRKTAAEVRLHYRDISKVGVEFRQERVESIDPERRRVTTDSGSYDADVLAVALGADYDFAATPDSRRVAWSTTRSRVRSECATPSGLRVGDDSDRDPGPPVQVPARSIRGRTSSARPPRRTGNQS